MNRILITGASGFVGRSLVQKFVSEGLALTVAGRSVPACAIGEDAKTVVVGEVGPRTDWSEALEGCDVVVHMAAQVPTSGTCDRDFNRVNNEGTACIVEQATNSSVKMFVLLSSVFAVVDNAAGDPVDGHSSSNATTSYGLSKLAAEAHVARFVQEGRIGISLRSPLVYGGNAKGNWRQLQRLAASRLPLPLGMIHNRRSLIAIENLTDALLRIVTASRDIDFSGVYTIADGDPVSTADIIRWLREGMCRPTRLMAVPPSILDFLLRIVRRRRMAQSLLGDLVVNDSEFRDTFRWVPPLGSREAIAASGAQFLEATNIIR